MLILMKKLKIKAHIFSTSNLRSSEEGKSIGVRCVTKACAVSGRMISEC